MVLKASSFQSGEYFQKGVGVTIITISAPVIHLAIGQSTGGNIFYLTVVADIF
jgi:hypothetical protein